MIDNLELEKLKNDYCTLEPLSYEQHDNLIKAANDGELWNLKYATIPKPDEMRTEIKRRINLKNKGSMLPFAVIHNESKQAVGMTTYCKINIADKQLDIGWTWYAKSHQRTALNTNCKLLLLTNAFETMKFETVYFKVHVNNLRSQTAVLRLGASFIGVIKNYLTMPDKKGQDYNHYCINLFNWPDIKKNLLSCSYSQNLS